MAYHAQVHELLNIPSTIGVLLRLLKALVMMISIRNIWHALATGATFGVLIMSGRECVVS